MKRARFISSSEYSTPYSAPSAANAIVFSKGFTDSGLEIPAIVYIWSKSKEVNAGFVENFALSKPTVESTSLFPKPKS